MTILSRSARNGSDTELVDPPEFNPFDYEGGVVNQDYLSCKLQPNNFYIF